MPFSKKPIRDIDYATQLERSEIRNAINTLRSIGSSQVEIFDLISEADRLGFFGKHSITEVDPNADKQDYNLKLDYFTTWNPVLSNCIAAEPWPTSSNTNNTTPVINISDPIPKFFVYQPLWKLSTQGEICFAINGRSNIKEQSTAISVKVEAPHGNTAYVKIIQESGQPLRYACSFRAIYNGRYVIRSTIGGMDIEGSPTIVTISGSGDLVNTRSYTLELLSYKTIYQPLVELSIRNPWNLKRLPALAMEKPWGIATNPATEDIYVTYRDACEVHCYTYNEGKLYFRFRFGETGNMPHCFKRPTGIAVDSTRNRLIIVDKDNHRVGFYKLNGEFLMNFGQRGTGKGDLNYPWDVAVSPNGQHIAVTDYHNHRVQLFDSNGVYLRQYCPQPIKNITSRHLLRKNKSYPRGIAFNSTGTIMYVTDFNQDCLFSLDLEMTKRIDITPPDSINRPQGIALNPATGCIAVCETPMNRIRVFLPETSIFRYFITNQDGPIFEPLNIAYHRDRIYVLESTGRVRIIV